MEPGMEVNSSGTQLMNAIWKDAKVAAQSCLIIQSLKHWTGRDLLPDTPQEEIGRGLFEAPFVVVSHGTETDPVLNYGNRAALNLWEMDWEELTKLPSRYTAEAPNREERKRLLAAVTANGFIDDYSGIRISKTGRRFRIEQATVWSLVDENGRLQGQAAMFDEWVQL